MAKETYYFSHDANARHDPNICEMRADYGTEGYGRYWILIEMLREQTDFKLKLCKRNAFAMQLQCDPDAAHKFIDDCINVYELFDSDGEYFWSNSLLERMDKVKEKSEKARQSALSRWENKSDANAMRTQCEGNAIKESKVKESKEKEQPDSYTLEFENFWNQYPRKTEKKAAFTKWKATKRKGATADDLITSATNYADWCKREGTEERYIKHAKTFLGPDEHWREYLHKQIKTVDDGLRDYTGATDEELYGGD